MRRAATSLARRSLSKRAKSTISTPSSSVQVTTLPNNIRVATESTPGHFSSVGLYVDAGSRYETPSNTGVSHFLDRMAFKTTRTRSDVDMTTSIDSLGGQIQCSSSREALMYQSSHFHSRTPLAVSLISDTVLNPAFLPEEILSQREATKYEVREIFTKPEMFLPETLHQIAYGYTGLGNSLICSEDKVDKMDDAVLRSFMREWYRPERIVVAGAGMQHVELVELVDKHMSSLKSTASQPRVQTLETSHPRNLHLLNATPTSEPMVSKAWTRAASVLYPRGPLDGATLPSSRTSGYTGGYDFIHQTEAELDHIYIGFEGVGIHDNDIYPLALIQVLLGGGGSFSAGGPGKGMFSRLYTHILNHHPQIQHCESFHHIYSDSSLFGIFASFTPAASQYSGSPSNIVFPHLVHQLSLLLYSSVTKIELQRAKNQLKSALMMALESRAVEVEDLGRQILAHGRKIPVTEMCDRIDEITPADIARVADRAFGPESGSRATVLCMGHDGVKDYQHTLKHYGVHS